MSDPTTHDFGPGKRYWGHDFAITKVIDSGRRVHASGWGPCMKVGDFIVLDNLGRETRYQIAEYEPVMEPNDMWHAVLTFAPRQAT